MPLFQCLRSFTVPKPEGGHYSKGIVFEMDETEAEQYGKDVIPYKINDTPAGAARVYVLTQEQIDSRIEVAVDKARTEWEAEQHSPELGTRKVLQRKAKTDAPE